MTFVPTLDLQVSADPAEVVPECNVILIPLPSFAYVGTLEAIAEHIRPGAFIGATPGQGGFDYIAKAILGPKAQDFTIFAIQPMPFNCRISEFGKLVNVQQFENEYTVSATPRSRAGRAIEIAASILGKTCTDARHFMSATLCPLNANIHPQRMYVVLKDWAPGIVLDENPLFYEQMGAEDGRLMNETSAEVQRIVKHLSIRHGLDLKVPTVYESEFGSFPDPSCKTVDQLFAKSPAYKGFRCPFMRVGDGWEPDFENRYFTEDVPYGLCVWKGIAELCGVATPTIDMLLEWVQDKMGKEYLVKGRLVGRDVHETSAPQRFGFSSIEQLIA